MKKLMEIITRQLKDSDLLTEEVKVEIKSELDKLINEKVEELVKDKSDILEESYNQKLQTITEEGQTKLDEYTKAHADKMNEYITEGVNEFIEKNELAIDSGIKVERATSLIEGIKTLLTENDILIEEEANDMVKELETSVTALKESNEKLIAGKAEADAQCFEFEKADAYNKLTKDLTDVKKSEVLKLYEGIESNTIEDFNRHIIIIIEKVETPDTNINENEKSKITDSLTRNDSKDGNGQVDQWL